MADASGTGIGGARQGPDSRRGIRASPVSAPPPGKRGPQSLYVFRSQSGSVRPRTPETMPMAA